MHPPNHLFSIYHTLLSHYGPQGWWPLYNNKTGKIEYHPGDYSFPKNEQQSFEISVGAILTQNTSWTNVEKALHSLHHAHALAPEKILSLSQQKLALLIHSSGYHNQKAKKLKAFARFIQSGTPVTRNNLLHIWGIGPETADSILLYAHHEPFFVVDAYTTRIFTRYGFPSQSYHDIQQFVMHNLPKKHEIYNELHALLVQLGKQMCKPKPLCEQCPLQHTCAQQI